MLLMSSFLLIYMYIYTCVYVCIYVYIYQYIYIYNQLIVIIVRVFANGPEDQGSIPGHVIPKTKKMRKELCAPHSLV